MRPRTLSLGLALVLVLSACATRQQSVKTPAPAVPVFEDLGGYHREIRTSSPAAQKYFDQGLRLVYAFNHYEGLDAFREATRQDPNCAICHWGIALSLGSNYNSPTDAGRETQAYEAIQKAIALESGASPQEQALIEATAKRHASPPPPDRKALDEAYADALRGAFERFPDDADIGTLFADSMMNLRPWGLWQQDGTPQPGTEEIVATLERVLAANPQHPGANHLYIHAVEASPEPGRAEAAADRLRGAVPGAGHLVHMPSHIYIRVGRYADAEQVNVDAAAADRAYFTRRSPSEIYRYMYYPHNIDFNWQMSAMEGRYADALAAARKLSDEVPAEMLAHMSDAEIAPAAPLYVLARFGKWDDILAQPMPAEDLFYLRGLWHYDRGLASNAKGDVGAADRELQALREAIEATPAARTYAGFFKTRDMLTMASQVLAGEIAARAGRYEEAVAELSSAIATQDTQWFTEPPPWYYPIRQSLGAVLLQAGRAADAEAVYREDLKRNPKNGWSLFGLEQALRAQNKAAEADSAHTEFQAAWQRADTTLNASRF
jgi:tetratricopeptide (TPR) repeat protein